MISQATDIFLRKLYETMAGQNTLKKIKEARLINTGTGNTIATIQFYKSTPEPNKLKLMFRGEAQNSGEFNKIFVVSEDNEIYFYADPDKTTVEAGVTYHINIDVSISKIFETRGLSSVTLINDYFINMISEFFNTGDYEYINLWDYVKIEYSDGTTQNVTYTAEAGEPFLRITFNDLIPNSYISYIHLHTKKLLPPQPPALTFWLNPPLKTTNVVFPPQKITITLGKLIDKCEETETWVTLPNTSIEVIDDYIEGSGALKITGNASEFGVIKSVTIDPPAGLIIFVKFLDDKLRNLTITAIYEDNTEKDVGILPYPTNKFIVSKIVTADKRITAVRIKAYLLETKEPPSSFIIDALTIS